MEIELYIDGELKKFTVPFVPALVKRKFLEIQEGLEEVEVSAKSILIEDDKYYSILPEIVFKGQFTLEQLYGGQSQDYIDKKMNEAIYGNKK